jgi:serine/threonine-protein kinase
VSFLLVESGPRKGSRIEIPTEGSVTLGSDPARAGALLDEPLAAPVHCVVGNAKGGGLGVKDLGTENGTYVNNRRVVASKLVPGDKVQIGGTILTLFDSAPAAKEADAFVGAELGGYRILEHLGRGGMGTVYRALQVSLDRVVALKVLSRDRTSDPAFVERFLREARAAAALSHPNLVAVYDAGSERGLSFYSMEFMEGGTVEDRILQAGKIPLLEGLRILRDAARALLFAEEKRIVHRDVKPGNLMVDAHGITKLADLGLAAEMEEVDRREGIFGTPHFISPEQARGEGVDARSDLYSFGASAYRILTGQTPFSGKTTREILRAQLKDEPPSPRATEPSIPPEVEGVVLRCLRKAPAERFATAREILEALEPVIDRLEGKRAGGLSPLWLVAAGLLVAGAGLGLLYWKPWEKRTVVVTVPGAAPSTTAAGEEVDRLRREGAEKDARLAYLEISSDLPEASRAGALEALATRFSGTEYGERAKREGRAIRETLAARAAAAEERSRRAETALADARSAAAAALRAERFAEAAARAANAPGIGEFSSDPSFTGRFDELLGEIERAASEHVAQAQAQADAKVKAGDFEGAGAAFDALRAAFDPLEGVPPSLRSSFEGHARLAADGRKEVEASRARARREALASDRATAHRVLFAPDAVPSRLLAFRFAPAREAVEKARDEAATAPYRRYLEEAALDLAAADRAFALFLSRAQAGSLKPDTLLDPVSGKAGRIVGVDPASGITVEVLVRGQTARSVLRWDRFDRPERLAELFFPRGELSPAEALDGASLVLLVGIALEAKALLPGLLGIRSDGGGARAAEAAPAVGENVFRLARDWLDRAEKAGPDPEVSARAAALRAKVEREEQAARALNAALAALTARRHDEAASRLEEFRASARGSLLLGHLTDGSAPPVDEER